MRYDSLQIHHSIIDLAQVVHFAHWTGSSIEIEPYSVPLGYGVVGETVEVFTQPGWTPEMVILSLARKGSIRMGPDCSKIDTGLPAKVALRLAEMHQQSIDPLGLMPEAFTVADLRKLHEAATGDTYQKDSFRRRVIPYLIPTGTMKTSVMGRPAEMYRFAAGRDD